MRIIILSAVLFFIQVRSNGQQTIAIERDSLYSIIKTTIKNVLDDRSYTRIPNTEFEERLETKVKEKVNTQVDQKFANLRNIVLLVLALIGGGILFGLKSLIGSNVKDQSDKEMKKIQDNLDGDIEIRVENYFLKNYQVIIDKQLKANRESIDLELKRVFETQSEINNQMQDIKKYLLEARLEQIKSEIDAKKTTEATFNSLNDILKEAEVQKNTVLLGKVINELSYASYYLRKDSEMENILRRFMDQRDISIKETVFMNMGSGFFYNYSSTYDETDRQKCLLFLNEALKRANGYGEALGLKLELYMVDYEKAQRQEDKQRLFDDAKATIEQIKKMDLSAYEVIKRFERVKTNKIEESYINLFYKLFPEDTAIIRKKAELYNAKKEPQAYN
ncbi:MAG: hypothetical protein EPN92_02795 [Chitinophagaceae bacterium]|nr:MAG: hypothetical protein EPN92_02795 [Chitinophagaceae bacterium]